MVIPRLHTVLAYNEKLFSEGVVAANNQSCVPGCSKIFRRIKAEEAGGGHAASHPSPVSERVFRTDCLCGIFDYREAESLRDAQHVVHIATKAEQMHWNYR